MSELTKYEIKILKYIKNHPYVSGLTLTNKFKKCDIELSTFKLSKKYVQIGSTKEESPDLFTYKITREGIMFLESLNFFTLEYFMSHILIPIVIAVISTLLTLFLTSSL